MGRKIGLLVGIFFLVFGVLGLAYAKKNHLFVSKKFKVYVDKSQVTENLSPKQLLLEKVEKMAADEILNSWSQKKFLFLKENVKHFRDGYSSFLVKNSNFTPVFDSVSATYEQLFSVRMDFLPCDQVAGDIIHIEGNKTLAAANYYITIKLRGLTPDENGSYFVIGRPKSYEKKQKVYYELIGGGKIYSVVDSIAQAVILVSSQEVFLSDKVFLVKTNVSPVVKEKKGKKFEEVIVEPEVIKKPKVSVPKESK